MDMEPGRQQFITYIKKYQYVFFAVLIGICLMLFPEQRKDQQEDIQPSQMVQPELEIELTGILSTIQGVGNVQVLLTEESGRDILYQQDVSQNQSNLDTVIVVDENRHETGLVKQVLSPVYRGAIVVCQGADSANVRLSIVDAVKSVTGLSSDRITVLKMK